MCPANALNSQNWTSSKPEARYSIQACHLEGRVQVVKPSPVASQNLHHKEAPVWSGVGIPTQAFRLGTWATLAAR